jgi:hypothetical protein
LGSFRSTTKLYPLRAADFVPDSATDLKFSFLCEGFAAQKSVDREQGLRRCNRHFKLAALPAMTLFQMASAW